MQDIKAPISAALYIRVSTTEQAEEGYSLAAQERMLREYCERNGYTVYDVYADEGVSGKSINKRKDLQRLLDDAAERRFQRVIVWKLTRFTRSLTDLCTMCDRLEARSIKLVSITEGFDTATSTGRMLRNILGVIAQWEREVISENVAAAMAERARQGKRTCSYVLGYDRIKGGDLAVNQSEAENVRKIFGAYVDLQNLIALSEWCNKRRITGKKGNPMSPEAVRKILSRPIYIGYYSFRGHTYRGNFDPIVDENLFRCVQDIMALRGTRTGRHKQLKVG